METLKAMTNSLTGNCLGKLQVNTKYYHNISSIAFQMAVSLSNQCLGIFTIMIAMVAKTNGLTKKSVFQFFSFPINMTIDSTL